MTLRVVDGFDYHTPETYVGQLLPTSGQVYRGGYTSNVAKFTATNARGTSGGLCLTIITAGNGYAASGTPGMYYDMTKWYASGAKVTVGMALYPTAFSNYLYLFGFFNTSVPCVTFAINSAGQVVVYGASSTNAVTLIGTTTTSLQVNSWNYLEAEVTLSGATLTVSLYLSGVLLNTFTQSNYYGTVPTCVILGASSINSSISTSLNCYYDDFYMLDNSGSVNTSRLGDIRIEALYPSSEAVNTNFVRTGGTGASDTLGRGSEDTTTYYTGSSVSDELILATTSTLTVAPSSILAVSVTQLSERTDTKTTRAMAGVVLENSVETAGAGVLLEATYDYLQTHFPSPMPSSGAAWAPASISALKFGVRVTA